MMLQLCQELEHDVDLHLHLLWLSHVSIFVLGYHVELLPGPLHKQSFANHTPCEVDLSSLAHES